MRLFFIMKMILMRFKVMIQIDSSYHFLPPDDDSKSNAFLSFEQVSHLVQLALVPISIYKYKYFI